MQEITFAKGNEQHLKDCRDALCRSTLGERYFSSPGSAEIAVLEGIRQKNLYVAFIGEECVGFTYIIPKGAFHSFPYLHIIAVKEEYRNKGIGKALLDYSEKIAYEMADKFFLVVADYNPDAKRFYERNGYQQVGEIPNLYRPGVTEYMMAKNLKKRLSLTMKPMFDWKKRMVLETKRLLLREMKPDDFQALFLVLGSPETMWHYPYTFDGQHVRDWIERNIKRYQKDGFGLWAVCLKESGEMIGDCGLTLQNINGETLPEIGYHIRHDCQRKGYASEAAKAVRNWAFRNTDYPTLYSYCKYTNVPSIKTAESIGMHFVCEYPDETNGTTHVSAISREEWLNEITETY